MFILKGLAVCLRGSRRLRNEIVNAPDFWSIIDSLRSVPEAAGHVFDLLLEIMEDSPSAITADNYEFAISSLNGFARAGSIGVVTEQKRDRHGRRPKSIQAVTPK